MCPHTIEQAGKPDPFSELAKKEAETVTHGEWLEVHMNGLLELYETGQIPREKYLEKMIHERQDIEEQALTDSLTGIPNRRGLDYEIKKQLKEAERMTNKTGEYRGSVIFLDVDKLKQINDTYGHIIGDKALVIYAKIIKNTVRPGDTIGRYGGDEFVIYAKDTTEEQAEEITNRIRLEIIETFKTNGLTFDWEQSISAGVSQLRKGDSITSLLDRADKALDYAKKHGKNQVKIFDDDQMNSMLSEAT